MTNPLDNNNVKPSLEELERLQTDLSRATVDALLYVAKCEVVTGGDSGVAVDIPMGAEIVGAICLCTRSNGSGSMTIKTNGTIPNTISNAMAATTEDALALSSTIDSTYAIVGSDGIAVFANAAADAANVYILYKK